MMRLWVAPDRHTRGWLPEMDQHAKPLAARAMTAPATDADGGRILRLIAHRCPELGPSDLAQLGARPDSVWTG